MHMSAELFQSIVQSIQSDDQPTGDKRGSARSAFSGKVEFVPPGGSSRVQVAVRDLSVQGIGLLHSQPLKCGEEFTIALADPTSDGQRGVVCTVVRWQPISDTQFVIGARFTRTVTHLAGPAGASDHVAQLQKRLKSAGLA